MSLYNKEYEMNNEIKNISGNDNVDEKTKFNSKSDDIYITSNGIVDDKVDNIISSNKDADDLLSENGNFMKRKSMNDDKNEKRKKRSSIIQVLIQLEDNKPSLYEIPSNEITKKEEKTIKNLSRTEINKSRSLQKERDRIFSLFGWTDTNEYDDSKVKPKFKKYRHKQLKKEI
jgi:hypothetical protein